MAEPLPESVTQQVKQARLRMENVTMDAKSPGNPFGSLNLSSPYNPKNLAAGTPPSEWFDKEANRIRTQLKKIAADHGIIASGDQQVRQAMQNHGTIEEKNHARKELLEKAGLKAWDLTPAVIENPANKDDRFTFTQLEALDLMKTLRLEKMSNSDNRFPKAAPTRDELEKMTNSFLSDVLQKSKESGRKLADVYKDEKIELLKRVEKQVNGKNRQDVKLLPKEEWIDFDKYKVKGAYDKSSIIQLSMGDGAPTPRMEDLVALAAHVRLDGAHPRGLPAKTRDPLGKDSLSV